MSFTNRVLAYFCGTVAALLFGASVASYFVVSRWLFDRLDERLLASFAVVDSAIEEDEHGLEWEPRNQTHLNSDRPHWQPCHWAARVDAKKLAGDLPLEMSHAIAALPDRQLGEVVQPSTGIRFRAVHGSRTISSPGATASTRPDRHSRIEIQVANSVEPIAQTLSQLLGALAIGSTTLLALTFVGGRFVCRRALRPLTEMADACQSINADDFTARLPLPTCGDELQQLGSAFNRLLGRQGETLERERRFASEASHQLRTPATAIYGQAEVALRQERSNAEYRNALAAIRRQSASLNRLVETLLALARDPSHAVPQATAPQAVDQWLSEVFVPHWQSAAAHQVLCLQLPECPISTMINLPILDAALGNVVDNASKYGNPGGRIEIAVAVDATRVTIRVTNDGPGIETDQAKRIFEPFYRGRSQLQTPGFGLGLALSKRLMEAVGGSIVLASSTDGRTCFAIQFARSIQ